MVKSRDPRLPNTPAPSNKAMPPQQPQQQQQQGFSLGGLFSQDMMPFYAGMALGGTREQQGRLATQALMERSANQVSRDKMRQQQQQFDRKQSALEKYNKRRLDLKRKEMQGGSAQNKYLESISQIEAIPDEYLGDDPTSARQALIRETIGLADKDGKKTVPSEIAGKMALAETAMTHMQDANQFYLPEGKEGSQYDRWDRVRDAGYALGWRPFKGGESGRARRSVRLAVETGLRLATGAAAPDSEVDRYMDMFSPTSTDTPETIKQKMNMLNEYIANARRLGLQGRGNIGVEEARPLLAPGQRSLVDDSPRQQGSGGGRYRYNRETGELE